MKSDHRSTFSNLSNWNEEALEISGLQRDPNPRPPRNRCDAQPNGSCCVCRFVTWASVFFALNVIQLMRMQESKTLNKNNLNSVTDRRFLLKQWFFISAHS